MREAEIVGSPPTMKTCTIFCHLPKWRTVFWFKNMFSHQTEGRERAKYLPKEHSSWTWINKNIINANAGFLLSFSLPMLTVSLSATCPNSMISPCICHNSSSKHEALGDGAVKVVVVVFFTCIIHTSCPLPALLIPWHVLVTSHGYWLQVLVLLQLSLTLWTNE